MAGSGAASKLMKVAFQKLLAKDSGNFNSVLSKVICIKHGGPRGDNFFRFPGGVGRLLNGPNEPLKATQNLEDTPVNTFAIREGGGV